MSKYLMQRGWMDMPIFEDEPYTEREAFAWMIENACWKDGRVRCGNVIVSLKRGQLAYSERFLAGKWRWTKSKVHRYLNRLKSEPLIETDSKQLVNVITICQYDELQDFDGEVKHKTEPANEPAPNHLRTSTEPKKNTRITPDNTSNTSSEFSNENSSEVPASRNFALQPPPSTAPQKLNVYEGEANETALGKRIAVPISSTFDPNPEWGDYAEKMGFSQPQTIAELEKFIAYFTVGRGGGKRRTTRGWRQSWSTWLDRANQFRR